jgi:hypothetical protein
VTSVSQNSQTLQPGRPGTGLLYPQSLVIALPVLRS